MARGNIKREQFVHALARTREAMAEFDQTQSTVVRDGAIQRFEFTAELAWKSCREKLMKDGFINLDSPKHHACICMIIC